MRVTDRRRVRTVANKVLSMVLSMAMLINAMPTATLAQELGLGEQPAPVVDVLQEEDSLVADDTQGQEELQVVDDQQQEELEEPAQDETDTQDETAVSDEGPSGSTQEDDEPETTPQQQEETEQQEQPAESERSATQEQQPVADSEKKDTAQDQTDDDPSKEPLSYVDPNAEFPIREQEDNPLLANEELAFATLRTLAAGGPRQIESSFEPITVDGTTLESLGIKWTIPSMRYKTDGEGNLTSPVRIEKDATPAGTDQLMLAAVDDEVPEHQFQIDFALSGKDRYEPGTIEIVIPASVWTDRDGNVTMELTSNGLSIPEEGSANTKKAEFVFRRVDDNIVITNNRRMDASKIVMIQGHFESVPAHTIEDLTVSSPLAATITITTKAGNEITATTNAITAQMDTYQKVNDAYKTAYSEKKKAYEIYSTAPSDLPEELLPEDATGDNYVYVRWAVAGSYTGNQPATLSIQDSAQQDNYGCVMLGVTGLSDGRVVKSEDGNTVEAVLREGSDGYSTNLLTAYVWTAYPVTEFPQDGSRCNLENEITVTAVGLDDELVSSQTASAVVPMFPPKVFTVSKVWNDNNNADGHRPSEVTVRVDRRNTSKEKNPWEYYKTLTLSEASEWKTTWTEEPGTETWEYRVYENVDKGIGSPFAGVDEQDAYVWVYERASEYAEYTEDTRVYTLTNTYKTKPAEKQIVKKVWDDGGSSYRPAQVAIVVVGRNYYGNIIVDDTIQLNELNSWAKSWDATDYHRGVWSWEVTEVLDTSRHEDESNNVMWWYTTRDDVDTTQENETTYTFTNTLHIKAKQTYDHHVHKTWNDNNNAAGNRPDSISVNVYRDNVYLETIELSEANGWSYSYTEYDYEDHSYRFEEITTGLSQGGHTETRINADGSKDVIYHSGWKYVSSGSSGSITNTYVPSTTTTTHYPVIHWAPRPTRNDVEKTAKNYQEKEDKAKTGEIYLNDVLSGRSGEDLRFTVTGSSYHEAFSTAGGVEAGRMKRDVNFVLTDTGLTLDGHVLSREDYRFTAVSWSASPVTTYESYQVDVWSAWGMRSGRVAYDAVIQGLVNGTWVDFATINGSTATAKNGARVSGSKVIFPEDAAVTKTRLTVLSKAAGVTASYDVHVQLLPSEWLSAYVDQLLEEDDTGSVGYTVSKVTNTATAQAFDDTGAQIFSKTDYDHEFVHAFDQRLGALLEKSFVTTRNDKVERQLVVHTSVKLTQQSNVTDAREWANALAQDGLPMSESGIWYDLLPQGMLVQLDTVKLGTGDTLRDKWVVENWRGTGRTLLCVSADFAPHESYTRFDDNLPVGLLAEERGKWPREGYKTVQTLEFDCLYPWRDVQNLGLDVRNVAAFESDEDVFGNLRGFCGEPDDPAGGNNVTSLRAMDGDDALEAMATDLDDARDTLSFVYAGSDLKSKIVDFSGVAGIVKQVALVGSNAWSWGRDLDDVDDPVVVAEGGAYMYRLTVAGDPNQKTTNIVIADTLEEYVLSPDDAEELEDAQEKGWASVDDEGVHLTSWKGRLTSLDLNSLEAAGVDPVVWWTDDPSVNVDSCFVSFGDNESEFDMDMLSEPQWHQGLPSLAEAATVASLVIDCRKANNNADAEHRDEDGNFVLPPNETISCVAYMRAPTDGSSYMADSDGDGVVDGKVASLNAHAYNNVHMSATTLPELDVYQQARTKHTYNNYTKVGIYAGEITVRKAWDDDDDRDGVRPENVTVYLVANGDKTDYSAVLSEENGWECVISHFPQVDENNKHIEYSVAEEEVQGYRMSSISQDGAVYTLTNAHAPMATSKTVDKVWLDDTDENGDVIGNDRPSYVVVDLYADGVKTDKAAVISAASEWQATFENLLKYRDHGQEIEYTVVERPVGGGLYRTSYDTADDGTLQVKNTYYPYGDLMVSKEVLGTTDASKDKEFTFRFAFRGPTGNLMLDEFEYETSDGRVGVVRSGTTITLQGGQTAAIKDLPHGSRYEITEEAVAGFTQTAAAGASGYIKANDMQLASFQNTYSASASYSPVVGKVLANAVQKRGQFKFELLDDEGTVIRTASSYPGTNADDVQYREGTDGQGVVSSAGTATFGTLYYDVADDGQTYTYTVREVEGEQPGYVYDEHVYTLQVIPHDKGDGTMWVDEVWLNADGEELEEGPVFRNTYKAEGSASLLTWKELGGGALEAEQFAFELLGASEDGTYQVLQTQKNNAEGEIIWEDLAFDETDIGKTYYFAAREVIPEEGDPDYSDDVIYDESYLGFETKVADLGDGALSIALRAVDATDMLVESEGELVLNEEWVPRKLAGAPIFRNVMKPGLLSIEKLVDDVPEGHEDDLFKFRLVLQGDDLPKDGNIFDMEGVTVSRVAKQVRIPRTVRYAASAVASWLDEAPAYLRQVGEALADGASWFVGLFTPTVAYAAIPEPVGTPSSSTTVGTNVTLDYYESTETLIIRKTDSSQDATVSGTTLRGALRQTPFASAKYVKSVDTISITGSMDSLFGSISSNVANKTVVEIDLNSLDVSKVTSMQYCFALCDNLQSINIKDWDVSNVSTFWVMFYGTSLKSIDVSGWTSNKASSGLLGGFTEFIFPHDQVSYVEYVNMSNLIINENSANFIMLGAPNLAAFTIGEDFRFLTTAASAYGGTGSPNFSVFGGDYSLYGSWYRVGIDTPEQAIPAATLVTKWGTNPVGAEGAGTWVRVGLEEVAANYIAAGSYTVNFDANTDNVLGSMPPHIETFSGVQCAPLYTIPECDFAAHNKEFVSWNTEADGSGTSYQPGDQMTLAAGDEITLYAQWEENAPSLVDGAYEIELPANYVYTIDGLPAGTAYSVYEETPAGWVLVSSSETMGTIQPLETATASFTNEYDPERATATLAGTKTFNGGVNGTAGYNFALYEVDSATAEVPDGAEPIATATSIEGGAFQFDTLTYGLADKGTHYYVIREVVPAEGGDGFDRTVIYDSHDERVTVEVADDAETAALKATVTYASGVAAFNNTTKAGSLTVGKTVATGNGDASQKFMFEIALHDAYGTPLNSVDVQMPDTVGPVALDASSGSVRVSLADGQTVTVLDLPAGTVYEVTELGLDLLGGVRQLPDLGWQQLSADGVSGSIQPGETSSATITNTYGAAPGEATLTVWKHLVGRALDEGEFTFQLLDAEGTELDTATNAAASGEDGHADDGEVEFLIEGITVPGTYTYTIKEVAGEDPDVNYSTAEITATVVMVDDGSGNLVASSVAYAGGDEGNDTFVNTLKPTSLTLSKQVIGATNVSVAQEFTFDVRLVSGGASVPDASYTTLVLPPDDDRGVTASGNTSTTVTYTEEDSILVWYSSGEGFFADNNAATNVVAYDAEGHILGGVEQTPEAPSTGKAFAGWLGEDGNAFDLSAALAAGEDVNVSATYTDVREARELTITSTDGVLSVPLRAGEVATIGGLPLGASYEVTEGTSAGWTQTGSAGTSGTFDSTEGTYQASFTNQYRAEGEAIITAKKALTGSALKPGQFSFELRDQYGALLGTASNDADGSVLFNPLHYTEADAGNTYRYYVYETAGNTAGMIYDETRRIADVEVTDNGDGTLATHVSYITVTRGDDGEPIETAGDDPTAFENDHRVGSLEVTKHVTGEWPTTEEGPDGEIITLEDPVFNFEVTFTPPEGEATTETFQLKKDESRAFEELVEGTTYVVREVDLPDGWFVESTVGLEGTITYGEQSEASVTNHYTEDVVELSGQKHWERDLEVNRPESITVQLMDGERMVAEVVTTADVDWAYSFGEQPKNNAQGEEIAYTVREVEVPGYEASYYDAAHPQEGVEKLDVINTPKRFGLPITGGEGLAATVRVVVCAAVLGLASLALLHQSKERKEEK